MLNRDKVYIYGHHAVMEALENRPEIIEAIYLDLQPSRELSALAKEHRIRIERFDARFLPADVERNANHQGYIGLVNMKNLTVSYGDFVKNLEITPDTLLLVLGELQDPQNVGAVIRTAAAFGASGVLIPEHKQAQVSGTVVKVSAGMAFRVPLVSIGNVNSTLLDLKERGFWTYGLDMEAKQSIRDEEFEEPTVLVLGNEGQGIRAKTLENCDIPLYIPMNPQCESLNVAASAAVAMYAWSAKHSRALK